MEIADIIVNNRPRPHVMNNSKNDEWYTPKYIVDIARNIMGNIDLDPASCFLANQIVNADKYYSLEDDGLQQKWFGRVWLNPPYSKMAIKRFSETFLEKYKMKEFDEGIILVNNATETRWFQTLLHSASCACLLKGRVRFYNDMLEQANSPLQGQCLLYFGINTLRFSEETSVVGSVLMPYKY